MWFMVGYFLMVKDCHTKIIMLAIIFECTWEPLINRLPEATSRIELICERREV